MHATANNAAPTNSCAQFNQTRQALDLASAALAGTSFHKALFEAVSLALVSRRYDLAGELARHAQDNCDTLLDNIGAQVDEVENCAFAAGAPWAQSLEARLADIRADALADIELTRATRQAASPL